MGWRGTLRSLAAAARRAEREQQRRERAHQRAVNKARRVADQFSREVDADLKKVQRFEDKVFKAPIKTLELAYRSGRWDVTPLVDRTGKITFELAPVFASDPVRFEPREVSLESFTFSFLDCSITEYGTFLAIQATTSKGSSTLKLVTKSDPEKSRIALLDDDGQVYWGFDSSLGGRLIGGAQKTGIVAFEPFSDPATSFEVILLPKETKKNPDPEPIRTRVSGEAILDVTSNMDGSRSMVEQFEARIRGLEEDANRRASPGGAPPRAGGSTEVSPGCGCLILLACTIGFLNCFSSLENSRRGQVRAPVQHARSSRPRRTRSASPRRTPPRPGPTPTRPPPPTPAPPEPPTTTGETVIRWEETATEKVKIKVVDGKEVGRWRFKKKPEEPTKQAPRSEQLEVVSKEDVSLEGCGMLRLKLSSGDSSMEEDAAQAAVLELHRRLLETHSPPLRAATYTVDRVGPIKHLSSDRIQFHELEGSWFGDAGWVQACQDSSKRAFRWKTSLRLGTSP